MIKRCVMVAVLLSAIALLTACASTDPLERRGLAPTQPEAGTDGTGSEVSGILNGAGASSQETAMGAWRAGFQAKYPSSTITYDPVGSSGGRTQFIEGGLAFAGTDAPLSEEELHQSSERCLGAGVLQVPLHISPIAVIYHVPGLPELNLSPDTLAGIFNQEITQWDDPSLVTDNPGVDLPSLRITPVNRSDGSGTTENFTEYLAATAPGAWPHAPGDTWPLTGSQSAQGTSGVVQTVQAGHGTIGYADASKAGSLGIANIQVGSEFIAPSAPAAAAAVDASPRVEGSTAHNIVIDLNRTSVDSGTYPLVLISYSIGCMKYEDPAEGRLAQEFLGYLTSHEGQRRAAAAAGSAPISPALSAEITAAIEEIELS